MSSVLNSRKGQGATEYLVILGAVLLVTLVIVSLLGWFPSLGGSTREQQSKAYWVGATPFSITAMKLANSSVQFLIANRVSDKLTLYNITVDDGAGTATTITFSSSTSFNGGEEKTVTNTTDFIGGNLCTSPTGATTGNPYEYANATIWYSQGQLSNLKQVGARPLIGRCS